MLVLDDGDLDATSVAFQDFDEEGVGEGEEMGAVNVELDGEDWSYGELLLHGGKGWHNYYYP